MQINLEFMSMLAECQQNFHLPEHMKEGSHMYTYFSYPVTSCFFIPQMANNPISYAAIMTLRNVALPGFVIISSVSQIVNVMCLAVPAAVCLLILGFFGNHFNSSLCSVMSRL